MTNETIGEECVSFGCQEVPNPKAFGVFLLYFSGICTGICALNIYLTISRKLHVEFPVFIVFASQTFADSLNASFYIYGSICLLAQEPLPNLNIAVWIGYLEPYFYGSQLVHNTAVAFTRLYSVARIHQKGRPTTNPKFFYSLASTPWLFSLVISLVINVWVFKGAAAGYFHVEYASRYLMDGDALDSKAYGSFWLAYEATCIGTALIFYVVAWFLLKHQRRVHSKKDSSRLSSATSGVVDGGVPGVDHLRKTSTVGVGGGQRRMERNLFIFCLLNTGIAGINCVTWRYVGFLFAITDILNSVIGSLLMFIFIGPVRRELVKFSTWQDPPLAMDHTVA